VLATLRANPPDIADVIAQLRSLGISLPDGNVRVDYYGDSPDLSRSLLAMIRNGQKRAGTGLVWLHEHENVPIASVGDIEIVLTHASRPSVVTRITSVEIIPYSQVTPEYAAIEGEGDGSLEYWRKVHWDYFSRACERIGRTPHKDMPVVCSVFEVLHILPEKDPTTIGPS
jgi:uncharacterized protein YhfF